MDELCNKVSAFHISVRLQRLAETENLGHQEEGLSLLEELPFASESQRDILVLLFGELLPTPEPGCRPVWEPPILDYSEFEVIIEAQKELNVKEGGREICWRVDAFDTSVEEMQLLKYFIWLDEQNNDARDRGNGEEFSFWRKLRKEVHRDWRDATHEMEETMERHGKSWDEWLEWRHTIGEIATVKDANFNSFAELWWY